MSQPFDANSKTRMANLAKSLLHNVGVVIVGFGFALLGRGLDGLLGIREFDGLPAAVAAWLLVAAGFLLRAWATCQFYQQHMKVISLIPPDDPSEPCYEAETVQLLREIAEHVATGDKQWIRRHGRVYELVA